MAQLARTNPQDTKLLADTRRELWGRVLENLKGSKIGKTGRAETRVKISTGYVSVLVEAMVFGSRYGGSNWPDFEARGTQGIVRGRVFIR